MKIGQSTVADYGSPSAMPAPATEPAESAVTHSCPNCGTELKVTIEQANEAPEPIESEGVAPAAFAKGGRPSEQDMISGAL